MILTPADTDIPIRFTLPVDFYTTHPGEGWPKDYGDDIYPREPYMAKGTDVNYYNLTCAYGLNELPSYTSGKLVNQSILPKGWRLPNESQIKALLKDYNDNTNGELKSSPFAPTEHGSLGADDKNPLDNSGDTIYRGNHYSIYNRDTGVKQLWDMYFICRDTGKNLGTYWPFGMTMRGILRKPAS